MLEKTYRKEGAIVNYYNDDCVYGEEIERKLKNCARMAANYNFIKEGQQKTEKDKLI